MNNPDKDLSKNNANKKTKTKKQNPKTLNNDLNSKNLDNKEENNLLNKKKKREENKKKNKNEKKNIIYNNRPPQSYQNMIMSSYPPNIQNMYNQYNIGFFLPPIEMQMQQVNNNNQDVYHNIYYINNPYEFYPNELQFQPNMPTLKIVNTKDLKTVINDIDKRGIVNHIIGAHFIEEYNTKKFGVNEKEEKLINNKKNTNTLTIINNGNNNDNDNKNSNINDNQKDKKNNNKRVDNNENENENKSKNENKLKRPILIW